jgi:hypothetical protein
MYSWLIDRPHIVLSHPLHKVISARKDERRRKVVALTYTILNAVLVLVTHVIAVMTEI